MHIVADVAYFDKKDNAEAVTMVENGINVCKISFKTKSEVSNKWIYNKRLRRKVLLSTGALILNYSKKEGKRRRKDVHARQNFR